MATSKLNKEQYANIGTFAGIMLVYNSTNRDGETVQTAQHFFGKDFEPADKSDNEIFRVIKNMVATMWHTIAEEKKLRADADGIRSKFRATTPAEIIICDKSNNRIKRYDLTDSVWARIGLVPTKVDLEKSSRDFAKTIHAAAKAIRDAMNFAPNLAGSVFMPAPVPGWRLRGGPVFGRCGRLRRLPQPSAVAVGRRCGGFQPVGRVSPPPPPLGAAT